MHDPLFFDSPRGQEAFKAAFEAIRAHVNDKERIDITGKDSKSLIERLRETNLKYAGYLDAINSQFEIQKPYADIPNEVAWLISEFSKMAGEIGTCQRK